MRGLPDNRDRAGEQDAFLTVCHERVRRRVPAAAILESYGFTDATRAVNNDRWGEFYGSTWPSEFGDIKGADIFSALRKHLAGLQNHRCCYCAQRLMGNAYARPLEHVLARVHYPRFSVHFWNIAVSCERCNRLKGTKDAAALPRDLVDYPSALEFTTQFHPRIHRLAEHVKIALIGTNEWRYTLYHGETIQGRNLVDEVLLNAAKEEALEAMDPSISGPVAEVRALLEAHDERAHDKIDALLVAIHSAAEGLAAA